MIDQLRGVNHTGITVADRIDGDFPSRLIGEPGTEIEAAHLTDGHTTIELLAYTGPADRRTYRPRPRDVGSVHVGLLDLGTAA